MSGQTKNRVLLYENEREKIVFFCDSDEYEYEYGNENRNRNRNEKHPI